MLRLLLTLLVANLLALLWWQGALDSIVASGRDPERMRQQVDADRLKVVPLERLKAANSAAATAGPASTLASPVAAPVGPTSAATAGQTALAGGDTDVPNSRAAACQTLAPLDDAALTRARPYFAENARYFAHEIEALEDLPPSWNVVTVPSENLAAGQKKYADFKRQGFEDFSLLLDGPYRFGLSFGSFRSEQAARRQVDQLERRGVRSMRILASRASTGRSMIRYRYVPELLPALVSAGLAALLLDLAVAPNGC